MLTFNGTSDIVSWPSGSLTGPPFTLACFVDTTASQSVSPSAAFDLCAFNNGDNYYHIGLSVSDNAASRSRSGATIVDITTTNTVLRSAANSLVGRWASTTSRDLVLNAQFANKGSDTVTTVSTSGVDTIAAGAVFRSGLSAVFFLGSVFGGAAWSCVLTDAETIAFHQGLDPRKIRPENLVFFAPLESDGIARRGGVMTINGTTYIAGSPLRFPRRRVNIQSAGGAFTPKFRRTLAQFGTGIGKRQPHAWN